MYYSAGGPFKPVVGLSGAVDFVLLPSSMLYCSSAFTNAAKIKAQVNEQRQDVEGSLLENAIVSEIRT